MNSDKIEVSVQADLAKSAVGLINELTDYAKLNARRELQLSQRNELREIADRYDYGDDEIEF